MAFFQCLPLNNEPRHLLLVADVVLNKGVDPRWAQGHIHTCDYKKNDKKENIISIVKIITITTTIITKIMPIIIMRIITRIVIITIINANVMTYLHNHSMILKN